MSLPIAIAYLFQVHGVPDAQLVAQVGAYGHGQRYTRRIGFWMCLSGSRMLTLA
jgi:hypothetical protein